MNILRQLSSYKKIKQKWNASWSENLDSLININISELDKEKEAIKHQNMIQNILNKNEDNNIFLYSDELKNEQLNKLRAGIFYTTNFAKNSN